MKNLKLYVIHSLTLLALFGYGVWVMWLMGAPGIFLLGPVAFLGIFAFGYVFGAPGVWLYNRTIGKLVARIESE